MDAPRRDGSEHNEFDFEDMEDSFDLWELFTPKPKRQKKGFDRDAHLARCRAAAARRKAVNGTTSSIRMAGGRGLRPTYEGAAMHWYIHPSLTSVERLLTITYMARHSPCLSAEVARATGLSLGGACSLLHVLAGAMLIQRAAPDPRFRAPYGRLPYRWEITEGGRRYLWRAGLMNRKLLFAGTNHAPLRSDVSHHPLRALKRCAQPLFLRPAALALAYELCWLGPATVQDICTFTWMSHGIVPYYIRQWEKRGWVEQTGTWKAHSRSPFSRRLWGFTAAGRLALARHVDALRRAARVSGFRPEPVDWFFRYIPEPGEPEDPLEANSYTLFGKRYINIPRGKV